VADDELLKTLAQFHREIVVPDLERIIDFKIEPLREMVLANFDALWQRLDRLEGEYVLLNAAVQRLETRMAAVDEKLDKFALRTDLLELKDRVDQLQRRIDELEKHVI